MTSARIAIIGGGPGGLTLARLLKIQGISCRLFELDQSRNSRTQGSTLDLHKDSGQLALKVAGLFDKFEKYARRDGAALKFVDKDGKLIWIDNGLNPEGSDVMPPDRPEIDRRDLRNILLDSLDGEIIEWGRKVVNVSENDTSTKDKPEFTVEFADGEREGGFELVVGADGAWSHVRGLLTKEKPFYSGITVLEAHVNNVDTKHPGLAERVGLGTCFQPNAVNGALLIQRNSDGSVKTLAANPVDEDWVSTCGIDWTDAEASKQALVDSKFSGCDAVGKGFILESDGPLIVRPLYMLPIDITWETRPGVTIIGDAAHLMTPFAGVGVNLALTDALDLSEAIRSHFQDKVDWTTALGWFEGKMLERLHIGAKQTITNLETLFSGNSVEEIIRRLGQAMWDQPI